MAFRPCLLVVAVLPSIVACGGDDEVVVPEGPHYHYVVDKVFVPGTNTQAKEYGIDIGKSDGSGPDGSIDNRLGEVLSTLGGLGFDVQTPLDTAVAEGSIVLLADFQTESFASTTAAGIQIFLGDSDAVTPAPCNQGETYNADTKTGCKHHLDGTGMFSIASNSPTNAALGGKVAGGTFTGGPGDLSLQIALGGTDPINLNLIGARAKGSGLSEAMLGSGTSGGVILGGAIPEDDINTQVLPAIQGQIAPIIAEDCTMPGDPAGGCGCADDSTGKQIIGLFDTNPKDCTVSVEELRTNSLVSGFLTPDVKINGIFALSLGIKVTAAKGTYTVAGQM